MSLPASAVARRATVIGTILSLGCLWLGQSSHVHGDGGDAFLLVLVWLLGLCLAILCWLLLAVATISGFTMWVRGATAARWPSIAGFLWSLLSAMAAVSFLSNDGDLHLWFQVISGR